MVSLTKWIKPEEIYFLSCLIATNSKLVVCLHYLLLFPFPVATFHKLYHLEQDSKAQVTAIHLIIGTLQRMNIFGVENRDTLTHKATGVVLYLVILFCVLTLLEMAYYNGFLSFLFFLL